MDVIERVGALVGIAAFLVLAVLAVLFFLQARDVRRLREWAGQAPERAAAIAELEALEVEAKRAAEEEARPTPSRTSRARGWLSGLGRRLPVDPVYLGAIAIGLVIAAGAATSGFGLLAGEGEPTRVGRQPEDPGGGITPPERTDVAVLNATSPAEGVEGFPGLAQLFQTEVASLDYRVAEVENAPFGLDLTAVMYAKGKRPEARRLATRLEPAFAPTDVEVLRMTDEIGQALDGTELALVIGRNYQPPPEEPTEPGV